MSFLWIESLWLLLLVPVLIAGYILIQRRRQKYALRYSSLSIVKEALIQGPGFRRHIPPSLFLAGLLLIIFAMARPVATVILPSQQGTVILAIDVSMSMRANDFKPNRLEAAKAAAIAFVEKQPKNVRIGVVSFSATTAIAQAPTTDREAVTKAINRLTMQSRTAIGSGILTSLDAIFEEPGSKPAPISRDALTLYESKPPPPPVSRGTYAPAVVILLSDGMSNTGPRPLDVIEQAANRGVRIYTVGVGSLEGAPLDFGGYGMRMRLDEETLKSIASKTDAKYFKAGNESELLGIYDNLGTQVVFKSEETELTAFFTGAAAVLMVLAGVFSLLWFSRLP
jgi:Ca-activated chloride channel homolog